MNGIIMIGQLLAGLSLLVFFHELGHFLVARACGIRVEKFYLFFDARGIKLLHFKIGETEYGIGWLPLGGYCKISGMIDESSVSADGRKTEGAVPSSEPQPWEYRAHPAWQRFLVSIGGVVMNLLVGIFIFSALLVKHGSDIPNRDIYSYPTVVKEIASDGGAFGSGLQAGDTVFSVNRRATPSFGAFKECLSSLKYDSVVLGVLRAGSDTLHLSVYTDAEGRIGIYADYPVEHVSYNWGRALRYGTVGSMQMLKLNAQGLGGIVTGREKASESLQGPIGIATIYGSVWDWVRFWTITAMLSLALAFMNFLPIPGLDGGHLLFALYEMVTRRKVSDRFMMNAQMIGMALIFALFVFVIFNDITRLFR